MRSAVFYGGVGYGQQFAALKAGVHLVVGTPGRVLDHLMRGSLSLDHLQVLVLDEADRMLSIGFYQDMKEVQRYLPKRHVTTCLFSATYPPRVRRLAEDFLVDPYVLSLSSDHVHVTDTEHVYYEVPGMEKDRALVRIIEVENPSSALIFCNTKVRVEYVATVLRRFGYDADYLSGDLSQKERERVLERIRNGSLRFLVATDVAARGIDISELSHVFQYELPEDHEIYIHRAGRTGRAGASGVAITLVDVLEKRHLSKIGRTYSIDFQEIPTPTDETVNAIIGERAIALMETQLRTRDRIQTERRQRYITLARELAEDEDGVQSLAMLLDDYYEKSVHAPTESHVEKTKAAKSKSKSRNRRSRSDKRR
jgi:ATP-dependent RNA helicase DeaD